MTDLRQLLDLPGSEAVLPDLDELWIRGRRRRQRRRLASISTPVVVLLAIGVALLLAFNSRGRSELETFADGNVPTGLAERVWVIPSFTAEPREAHQILFETPDSSLGTSLQQVEDPDLRIRLSRRDHGVIEDSGVPVDINGTPGYLRTTLQGSLNFVEIEWQVDGLWQVFQTVGVTENDAVDAARRFEADGIGPLAANGWELLVPPVPQEQITIIGNFGVFIFLNEQGPVPGAEVIAESNGLAVYGIGLGGTQLFVEHQGRLIFSYAPGGAPQPEPITPTEIAEGLDVVTEQEWRDWLATWSIFGVEIDESQIAKAISTWVNQLGLNQTDVSTWTTRFRRACSLGVWEPDVASELAEDFIAEDLTLSVRSRELDQPSVSDGAQALWTMSVQVCGDAFPPGAIEAGPPRP